MDLLLFNIGWMTWNLFLGLIGNIFGLLIFKTHIKLISLFYAFLWILFLPNTIYMVTDLYHVTYQLLEVNGLYKGLIILQFIAIFILGAVTYIWGMYPLDKILSYPFFVKNKIFTSIVFILFNILIAIGVVMGRIHRANSWELFTNISKVIQDAVVTVTSSEYIFLVLVFTIIQLSIYISCRHLFLPLLFKILPPKLNLV